MTDPTERLAALDARLAVAEARIAALEARPPAGDPPAGDICTLCGLRRLGPCWNGRCPLRPIGPWVVSRFLEGTLRPATGDQP